MDKITFIHEDIIKVNHIKDISIYNFKELVRMFIKLNTGYNSCSHIFIFSDIFLMYNIFRNILLKSDLKKNLLYYFGIYYERYLNAILDKVIKSQNEIIECIKSIITFFKGIYSNDKFPCGLFTFSYYINGSYKNRNRLYLLINTNLLYVRNKRIKYKDLKNLHKCLIYHKIVSSWKSRMVYLCNFSKE